MHFSWLFLLLLAQCWLSMSLPQTALHKPDDPEPLIAVALEQAVADGSTKDGNEDFAVDVNRFAQLLSTHLLFDHLDHAFFMLSKKISVQFRDSFQVSVQTADTTEDHDPSSSVDVQILKGQLQGAVGSFVEDKLPNVWSQRASALDRSALQSYIESVVMRLCATSPENFPSESHPFVRPPDNGGNPADAANQPFTVASTCLNTHARQFLSSIDRYVSNHVKRTMTDIVSYELPGLYSITRSQVNDILKHFNEYILGSSGSQLQLVLSSDMAQSSPQWTVSTGEMNEILGTVVHWETPGEEQREDEDDDDTPPIIGPYTMVHAVQHFASMARTA
ncbi:hypothetical protein BCR43DRAFT_484766 [Syncephalastrum racemosum]|uniref:Uncharacterized protein n=1 Tax=Syncephalastrum racemosum TaxID=13706 RepID=A0A1X2HLE0_SYNRA|nr:hypothetical protein BCR43DRAFT_484766 [Syncephalastrum racemosum]